MMENIKYPTTEMLNLEFEFLSEGRQASSQSALVKYKNQIGYVMDLYPRRDSRQDQSKFIIIFMPAEYIVAGECRISDTKLFDAVDIECENNTHYFPSYLELGNDYIVLDEKPAYLHSNTDFRVSNPQIGVCQKRSPQPTENVWAIRKDATFTVVRGNYDPDTKYEKYTSYVTHSYIMRYYENMRARAQAQS